MMIQPRYAHLECRPDLKIGDVIAPWQKNIARMGSSGQSTADHLHFDIIQKRVRGRVYRLEEIPRLINDLPGLMQQYRYFLEDDKMFGIAPEITTYFGDPRYMPNGKDWKFHPAFDLVPEDRKRTNAHYDIHWNRSKPAVVADIGYDEAGYGHYLVLACDV